MVEKRKNSARRPSVFWAALLIVFGVAFLLVNVFSVAVVRQQPLTVDEIGQRMGQAAGQAGESLGKAAGEMGQSFGEAAGNLGENIGEAAGKLGQSFGETAGEFGQSIGDAFSDHPAPRPLSGWWPVLLIAVGLYLLLRRSARPTKVKHDDSLSDDDWSARHDIV